MLVCDSALLWYYLKIGQLWFVRLTFCCVWSYSSSCSLPWAEFPFLRFVLMYMEYRKLIHWWSARCLTLGSSRSCRVVGSYYSQQCAGQVRFTWLFDRASKGLLCYRPMSIETCLCDLNYQSLLLWKVRCSYEKRFCMRLNLNVKSLWDIPSGLNLY